MGFIILKYSIKVNLDMMIVSSYIFSEFDYFKFKK